MLKWKCEEVPVFENSRFRLRPMNIADAAAMYRLWSHPEVLRYLDKPPLNSEAEAALKIRENLATQAQSEGIYWAIEPVEQEGNMIGYFVLWNFQRAHYRAELGYLLWPDWHRQGVMKGLLPLVIQYAVHHIGLHSIEAHVNPNNTASMALLLATGFQQEAYFRENYCWKGQFLDTAVFSYVATSPNSIQHDASQ